MACFTESDVASLRNFCFSGPNSGSITRMHFLPFVVKSLMYVEPSEQKIYTEQVIFSKSTAVTTPTSPRLLTTLLPTWMTK